jgi:signal recognition particle GTPase
MMVNKEQIKEYKKEYDKEYNKKNKEKIKEQKKEYYQKNKEQILEYRQKNKEKFKEQKKEYYKKNKEKFKEYDKEYRQKNKEKLKEYKKEYQRKRYQNDVDYRITDSIRRRIRKAIKSQAAIKSNKSIELLGCSIPEVRQHLENQFKDGMSWENHGEWHIDHIKPCASFDLTDPKQQKECFNYKNLQPLWAEENLTKGAKIIE